MAMEFLRVSKSPHKRKRETPLEYMLRVLNDETVPDDRRDRMAGMAAPYCHAKVIQTARGKKHQQTEAAATAGVATSWKKDLEFENRAQ
jgi:hypothetical protein